MARVALGEAEAAYAAAVDAMNTLEGKGGAEDVELVVRLAHAEALRAVGKREAAAEALRDANKALIARACAIVDPAQRETFLKRVPVNARILQLGEEWSTNDV
jgi:hypothetical protein